MWTDVRARFRLPIWHESNSRDAQACYDTIIISLIKFLLINTEIVVENAGIALGRVNFKKYERLPASSRRHTAHTYSRVLW